MRAPQPSGTNRPSSSQLTSQKPSLLQRAVRPSGRLRRPSAGKRTPPPGRRPERGGHTRNHSEPGSQAPPRREYCRARRREGRASPTGRRRSPWGGGAEPAPSYRRPVRLAVQDAALSRRRPPVRIRYGLPSTQGGRLAAPPFSVSAQSGRGAAPRARARLPAPAPRPAARQFRRGLGWRAA